MQFVERLRKAWQAFCGNTDSTCVYQHVLPNHTIIENDRLRSLEESTDELKFALGFIAHGQGHKYEESVVKVIGHEKKR